MNGIIKALAWIGIGVCLTYLVVWGASCSRTAAPEVAVPPADSAASEPVLRSTTQVVDAPPPDQRVIELDGKRVVVGSRDRVTFEMEDESTDRGAASHEEREAKNKGVGLKTSAQEVAQTFKAESAKTGLSGIGNAAGGGFSYDGEMTGGIQLNVFHAVGIALILGGLGFVVVPLFFKQPPRVMTALALGAGGIGFIAIAESLESMPMAWAVGGMVILVGVGIWLFNAIRSGKFKMDSEHKDELGEAVVLAVSTMDDTAKAAFKSAIGKVLDAKGPDVKGRVETLLASYKAAMGK